MKLNTKVRYGLRATVDIAENQKSDGILQKEIAERQEIPLKYLDTIITGLRNKGIIINVGGKSSGYKLTKQPSDISVYEIYRAFEPELSLVNCLCDSMVCNRSGTCPARDYWFDLNQTIKIYMENTSIDDILKKNL